jgi:hypothetical protein
MKKTAFVASCKLVFALLIVFAHQPATAQNNCFTINPGPSLVSLSGRQLIVQKRNPDGTFMPASPYVIKGVCWSPASPTTNTTKEDINNANIRRLEFIKWYKTDAPLLKKMNVNTIRSFMDFGKGDTTKTILDEFYCNDIMVIMTVDDAINDTARIRSVVQAYKNHPAILMWMIGNEWNINHYYSSITIAAAVQRTQVAASLIKSLDANHPVSTSYGDIDINAPGMTLADTKDYVNNICTSVDVWGLNIYRGGSFGALFSQWSSITGKAMFISEFGTDAFISDTPTPFPTGHVDETIQANWDAGLWREIYRQLSAYDPLKVAIGGTVFEWSDEWWKVSPPFTQETGGYAGAHPDFFANEDYFGINGIDRKKRVAYDTLRGAFHPAYSVAPASVIFRAASAGYSVPETVNGFVRFYKGGALFYNGAGNVDLERNRSFNIVTVDTATGDVVGPVRNFDTWLTAGTGTEMRKMMLYLDSIPNGKLIMIAVRDEAGLTYAPPSECTKLAFPWVDSAITMLESMGSTMIRNYCFRNSWAMITVKGTGIARDEQLKNNVVAAAQTTLQLKGMAYPPTAPAAPSLEAPQCAVTIAAANVTLQWNRCDAATSYRVQVAADSNFSSVLLDNTIADTSKALTGLENRKIFYWRARAINAAGAGRWSCTRKFSIRLVPYAEVISAPVISTGDTLRVKYEFFNALNAGNNLILQLTDASGNPGTYVEIARFTDTARAGVLKKQLANNFICGTAYRARVISTNPADTSINSGFFSIQNKPIARILPPASTTACEGQTILLNASPVTGAAYQWSKDGAIIANATGQAYSAMLSGAYSVRVSRDGCDSLSNPISLAFRQAPQKPTITHSADKLSLVSSVDSGNQWFKDGAAVASATGKIFKPSSPLGLYRVQVTINGCTSAISDSSYGPADRVYIFPNPVSRILNIVNNDPAKKNLVLRLFDANGRLLKEQQVQFHLHRFDMGILPKGVYVLQIMNGGEKEVTERILKL